VDGKRAKASDTVQAGKRIVVKYPSRLLEVELLELPGKSVSKKAARDLYRVLKDEKVRDEPF
jgi:ribosomal 50S subunit-recycling heat shock protein